MLDEEWDNRLRLFISAIIQNQGHKMLAINNVTDHMHFFVGLNPNQSISDMMRFAKQESSLWINKEGLTKRHFNWQDGYGAFSHSISQINQVVQYIHNQKEHHKKITFLDEYKKLLRDFQIKYDERYLFKLPSD